MNQKWNVLENEKKLTNSNKQQQQKKNKIKELKNYYLLDEKIL